MSDVLDGLQRKARDHARTPMQVSVFDFARKGQVAGVPLGSRVLLLSNQTYSGTETNMLGLPLGLLGCG